MSKWILIGLITGCSQNFSTGVNSNDSGTTNRVIRSDSSINDGGTGGNVSIQRHVTPHPKVDSSTQIREANVDSSIPKEAEIHESGIDSVRPQEQKDSGSKDANVVDTHDDYMVDSRADDASNSGRPNCDNKTLEGCTGVYGQPCRTYKLPPYVCVCLLPSEDCILK